MKINELQWKDGDVYFWSYNEKEYDKRKDHQEMYWCCSNIGIVRGEYLEDTYWGGSSSKSFIKEDVINKLKVTYKGNLKDYQQCRKEDQAMYDDADILNLTHSDSSNQYYLKLGAVKSKDKMIKIIKRNALKLKADYEYAKRALEWELDKLKDIDAIDYAYGLDGVSLGDESYADCEIFKIDELLEL